MLAFGHHNPKAVILSVREGFPRGIEKNSGTYREPFPEKTDRPPSDPCPCALGPVSAREVASDCSHLPRMLFIYFYVVKNESIGLETLWLLPAACY